MPKKEKAKTYTICNAENLPKEIKTGEKLRVKFSGDGASHIFLETFYNGFSKIYLYPAKEILRDISEFNHLYISERTQEVKALRIVAEIPGKVYYKILKGNE